MIFFLLILFKTKTEKITINISNYKTIIKNLNILKFSQIVIINIKNILYIFLEFFIKQFCIYLMLILIYFKLKYFKTEINYEEIKKKEELNIPQEFEKDKLYQKSIFVFLNLLNDLFINIFKIFNEYEKFFYCLFALIDLYYLKYIYNFNYKTIFYIIILNILTLFLINIYIKIHTKKNFVFLFFLKENIKEEMKDKDKEKNKNEPINFFNYLNEKENKFLNFFKILVKDKENYMNNLIQNIYLITLIIFSLNLFSRMLITTYLCIK